MYTAEARESLRSELLKASAVDTRLSGAAITGSAAAGSLDVWSDIDLAFGVKNADELPAVLADWTARMYDRHSAVHHTDVRAGAWIYRVFLLRDTLQVDLAFVPQSEFRALAPSFRLVYGTAQEARHVPSAPAGDLIGMAWLHALHARSCIARGRFWQAEYMVSGVRDHAMAMACIRHGLPAAHGRGFDLLPPEVRGRFAGALVKHLEPEELARAFSASVDALLSEIRLADAALAERLKETLAQLVSTARGEAKQGPGAAGPL